MVGVIGGLVLCLIAGLWLIPYLLVPILFPSNQSAERARVPKTELSRREILLSRYRALFGRKIRRQVFMLPIILSVGFFIGYIALPPLPSARSALATKLIRDAIELYLLNGVLAYIPFCLIASLANRSIGKDDLNIYQFRGALAGLSLVTFGYFFAVGAIARDAYLDEPGAGEALAAVFGFAVPAGLVAALLGWFLGFLFGLGQKDKRENNKVDRHPKSLWW